VSVREIIPDEVAFYEEHGWVKLDGLISRDTTAELLQAAKALRAEAEAEWEERRKTMGSHRVTFAKTNIASDPFYSFMLGDEIGAAAHTVINRRRLTDDRVAIRYCQDALICLPADEPARNHRYHQDTPYGTDRVGGINMWIALHEVCPEQAAMRFLTGSHREGPLGDHAHVDAGEGVLYRYPKLKDVYELSPPFHYQPGDVTVHHPYLIHGTPENVSAFERWCWVLTYIPADCVVLESSRLGLPEPHERFPIVYRG
jgi:ectoine hydroxylase-related dioxygenase (phytanoyl-CoA dioxygenase family)